MSAKKTICAIGALMLCAGAANASVFQWDWERGDPGSYGINDNGGRFGSVSATYDSNTNVLDWSVTFTNDVTEGFTLALNNGPNPKGHAGELALIYVDASAAVDPARGGDADVMLTAYAYNGKNSNNSYRDGDGNTGGNQTPDIIMDATQRNDWVLDASVVDINGSRTISFKVDASMINDHSPMYPDPTLPPNADPKDGWFGLGFGEQLGLWMHPYRDFDAAYDQQTGAIASLGTGGEGWFDGRDFTTTPTPGAAALLGMSGLAMMRRRRA